MIEMTLSSRHRVRNSNPGGLRPSTLPLGHGGSDRVKYNIYVGLVCSIKKTNMIYAIYGLETGFIVILDHENVGLHILLSTIR